MKPATLSVAAFVGLLHMASAIWLDTNNLTTIKEATALISYGLMDYYEGYKYGGTIGMFTSPYYWWEAGGAWGSLIDYSYYMDNSTYDDTIKTALLHQVGDDNNYIPLNQSTTEGNDDQGFWGIAVMAAAEKNFSNPDSSTVSWLGLTQAVFNTMTARWDMSLCGGGLRWQIFQWNSGYDYKNSVSNGCLFHIGARLARYTANDTYMDWAEKVWDWMVDTDLIEEGAYWGNQGGLLTNGQPYYFVYDGAKVEYNCSNVTKLNWSYNQGLFLAGSAYLYNYTGSDIWFNRTAALLRGSEVFFYNNSVMYEVACQGLTKVSCNNDQRSFKAYFSRFLGLTSVMFPESNDLIRGWLVDSANAAAHSCSGGTDGHTCGLAWTNGSWDGYYGLGEQMSALEVMINLNVNDRPPPYTAENGGSSQAHPASGYSVTKTDEKPLDLHTKDVAGASIITVIIAVSIIGTAVWLLI